MARDAALQHEAKIRAWLKGVPAAERSAALAEAADGHGMRVRRMEQKALRRNRGTWYTPPQLVDAVLQRALTARVCKAGVVCDPACGSGHFLVAAGRRMVAAGRPPTKVRAALLGTDLNAGAVALCRVRLQHEFGGSAEAWRKSVRCADALKKPTWASYAGTIDAVIGNPPFLSRLKRRSAPTTREAADLKRVFGQAVSRYSNIASAFLMLGMQLARERGGTVALVLPLSTCAAADAAVGRRMVTAMATMECCLLPPVRIFGGGVPTMVPVLRRGGEVGARGAGRSSGAGRAAKVRVVGICGGSPVAETAIPWRGALKSGNWGAIVSHAQGIPTAEGARVAGTVADHAEATADFRQHFYGLRGRVREEEREGRTATASAAWAPVVTVGVIDAARNLWGVRTLKLHGRTYRRPVANLTALRGEPELKRWVAARLRPKIVLATQTSAIEAWVDADGAVLPSTPLITVYPRKGSSIWKLGAVLLSPPVAAIAWQRHGGGALSPTALKLSASQVAALPLPADPRAWNKAARLLESLQKWEGEPAKRTMYRRLFAEAACDAYGIVSQPERGRLLAWWEGAVAGARSD